MKTLQFFAMVFGFGTQCVSLAIFTHWSVHRNFQTILWSRNSSQSCQCQVCFSCCSRWTDTFHWRLKTRGPANSSRILPNACCETASSSFELPFFFHEAMVFSLNERKIFLLSSQSMSAIWVNVWWHNTPHWPLPSLSLLLWSYSSSFMGWKLWQGLLIFWNTNGLLMLLRVIFM